MCVVFTLNRCFYPTTSVHPVSVLILHPREFPNYVVTDGETEKKEGGKKIANESR